MTEKSSMEKIILGKLQQKTIKQHDFEEWASKQSWNPKEIQQVMEKLKKEWVVFEDKDEYHVINHSHKFRKGILRLNSKGFGFVRTQQEPQQEKEIYVDKKDTNKAFDGDEVLIKILNSKKGFSEEAKVLCIINRSKRDIVGTYIKSGATTFVIPDGKNKEISIEVEGRSDLVTGHKVVVRLSDEDTENEAVKGVVINVIGHKNDPGVDILSVILKHELPIEFPAEVLSELEQLPALSQEGNKGKRKDFRQDLVITIDGEDAKDLDDAVHVKKLENGNFYLAVHIADVSFYVQQGSFLDKEAYNRSTSVYLVDRVIPMLPHKLSNDLCSLNPNEEKATMTCEMEITPSGQIIKYEITESLIKSAFRMTYTQVNALLDHTHSEWHTPYEEVLPMIKEMGELAGILQLKRKNEGALDFDVDETKILVDEEGNVKDIVYRERKKAERLIESFMLAANETVAHYMSEKNAPILYRVHEEPSEKKITLFNEYLKTKGYKIGGKESITNPYRIQSLFEKLKGKEEELVIRKLLLRSMKKARYTPENKGHYGLGMTHYSHFTSPIRRYPDLLLHRQLKKYITGVPKDAEEQAKELIHFEAFGEQTSERERRAIDAEREVESMKKAEFLSHKIGTIYNGTISSVSKFGFYVEIEKGIEGLVHAKSLDDFYQFEETLHLLRGRKTKKEHQLGDKVRIKVKEVNVEEGQIEFQLLTKNKKRKKEKNEFKHKKKWG